MRVLFLMLPLVWACQGPKTSSSQESVTEAAATTISYELSVEGMTCTGCENTILNAIKTVEGVSAVKASFENALVTVSLNTENADTAAIRQQIINSGYNPTGYFNKTE
jgi:copper chaperone CopZ